MFAPQHEIRNYLEHCATKYGIRPHIRFNSAVTAAAFDEAAGVWRIQVNGRDDAVVARAVVSAMGPLHRPAYPEIDGLGDFQGVAFHSAEWDHDYDFAGKRVAVIGTGASAIQFVPQIAKQAAQVHLVQRTPPWIVPKPDRRISKLERRLFRRFPKLQELYRATIYWRLEGRVLGFTVHPRAMKAAELVARAHIRRQIKDPELRRKVTPSYTIGCKRILISNDYYPALARDNVNVVTDGIARVTQRGIVLADGTEHEVDAIVFGTGFKVTDLLTPLSIYGRGGVDINDAWRDGIEAYLGTTVAGFPNWFLLLGPNTGLGHSSMVYMIESQTRYVLECLRALRARDVRYIEVRPEAQAQFNDKIQSQLIRAVWASGCKSWYLDKHGNNRTAWPGFTFKFRQATSRLREDDYEMVPAREPAAEPLAA
jgi:cation diffusion facilitator CzcD-associated flavoprotein CzcO